MAVIHLYPFVPRGRHGGTLRLQAAVSGTGSVAETQVHYFSPENGRWHRAEDIDALAAPGRAQSTHRKPRGRSPKRSLFPSTLWESGFRARGGLRRYLAALDLPPSAVFFLHTSYLAGSVRSLPASASGSVVDVYDYVAMAHRNDAIAAPAPLRLVRRVYSSSVSVRENRALDLPDKLLVAGYDDYQTLAARMRAVEWIPTPTPVEPVSPRQRSGRLRVGLIGNFDHVSTRAGAKALIESTLARDPAVTLVIAGLASDEWVAPAPGVEVLGPLTRSEDLYAQIDCVVAPVLGGSGIKCKLGEAIAAGRPVLTTALGAAGYSPRVRRCFAVAEPASIDRAIVDRAVLDFDGEQAREAVAAELSWSRVTSRYAAAATEALSTGRD